MIAIAMQRGSYVEVFNERNRQIFCRVGELHGHTSTTVTVKGRDGFLTVWDEKGKFVCARHA